MRRAIAQTAKKAPPPPQGLAWGTALGTAVNKIELQSPYMGCAMGNSESER